MTKKSIKLGRLKGLGLSEPWQSAVLMPKKWADYTTVSDLFSCANDGEVVVIGTVVYPASFAYQNNLPKLSLTICDRNGQELLCSKIGATDHDANQLRQSYPVGSWVAISGKLNQGRYLNNFEIIEKKWLGRMRPIYKGVPKYLTPQKILEFQLTHLKQTAPEAAMRILETVSGLVTSEKELLEMIDAPCGSLVELIGKTHFPRSLEEGERHLHALQKISCIFMLNSIELDKKQIAENNRVRGICTTDEALTHVDQLSRLLPFKATDEQMEASKTVVYKMVNDLSSVHHAVLGDVGTGKSAVIFMVSAFLAERGFSVAILMPTEVLAEQMFNDIYRWLPSHNVQLVTNSTKSKTPINQGIFVGTTSLLWEKDKEFDLVVVDEQQRFGREQREALLESGRTHLLETTATPIPRSTALMKYGAISISKLTKGHAEKDIRTTMIDIASSREAMRNVVADVDNGDRVIIIYARKDNEDDYAANQAYVKWEKLLGDKVRVMHSDTQAEDKREIMHAMETGAAQVLISTTVVETGVNIPRCRRMIIVEPNRFGLSTLHQLRGRLAREGGVGFCDLLVTKNLNDTAKEKLEAFCAHTDGEIIARIDCEMRGFGDLRKAGTMQSGTDGGLLFGCPPSLSLMDEIAEKYYA